MLHRASTPSARATIMYTNCVGLTKFTCPGQTDEAPEGCWEGVIAIQRCMQPSALLLLLYAEEFCVQHHRHSHWPLLSTALRSLLSGLLLLPVTVQGSLSLCV